MSDTIIQFPVNAFRNCLMICTPPDNQPKVK